MVKDGTHRKSKKNCMCLKEWAKEVLAGDLCAVVLKISTHWWYHCRYWKSRSVTGDQCGMKPTMNMLFSINNLRFMVKMVKFATSRHLRIVWWKKQKRTRHWKWKSPGGESYCIWPWYPLQFGRLIETMCREGWIFPTVGQPQVSNRMVKIRTLRNPGGGCWRICQ